MQIGAVTTSYVEELQKNNLDSMPCEICHINKFNFVGNLLDDNHELEWNHHLICSDCIVTYLEHDFGNNYMKLECYPRGIFISYGIDEEGKLEQLRGEMFR